MRDLSTWNTSAEDASEFGTPAEEMEPRGISFNGKCQRLLAPPRFFKKIIIFIFSKKAPEAAGVIVTKGRRESCGVSVALVALPRSRQQTAISRRVA